MDLFQATEMQGKDGDRMNKAFEKIVERLILESSSCKIYKLINPNKEYVAEFNAYKKCIEIVKEVAEKYNGGWIACSERLPDVEADVLLSLRSLDVNTGFMSNTEGYFYVDGEGYVEFENVLAWQPLPEPFKERD